jgi:hypothetical protein
MNHPNDPDRVTRTGMRDTSKATGSNIAMMLGLAALIVLGAFLLWPTGSTGPSVSENTKVERPVTPPATTPAPTTTPPAKAPAQ